MNEITIFQNQQFGAIRMLTDDQGEPWFVGKDIAEALGYSNNRKALLDHVDDEDRWDGVTIRDAIGRRQKAVFINESGLGAKIETFWSKIKLNSDHEDYGLCADHLSVARTASRLCHLHELHLHARHCYGCIAWCSRWFHHGIKPITSREPFDSFLDDNLDFCNLFCIFVQSFRDILIHQITENKETI